MAKKKSGNGTNDAGSKCKCNRNCGKTKRLGQTEACRWAAEEIASSLPEIVAGNLDKAKEGSYLHAKFLLDWAHIRPAEKGEEDCSSFVELLLKKLEPLEGRPVGLDLEDEEKIPLPKG